MPGRLLSLVVVARTVRPVGCVAALIPLLVSREWIG